MSQTPREPKVYDDGMTKQTFKNQTDINRIIAKAQKTGTLSHLAKYEPVYGDYSDIPDLLEASARLERANQIFAELPSEIRAEFHQSPRDFFAFVNNPANAGRLRELLPELAKPGRQHRILDPQIREAVRDGVSAFLSDSQTSDNNSEGPSGPSDDASNTDAASSPT